MKKVLITGCGGFTAKYLSEELVQGGYDVYGLTSGDFISYPKFRKVYKCSLADTGVLSSLLKKISPDYIVHLAAISFVGNSNLEQFYAVNVLGTENLMKAILESGISYSRVIVASSANIYGNKDFCISETAQPSPLNHYAISKVSMEHVVSLYTDKIPILIVRPFNYTGVGQKDHFLVPKIAKHFKNKSDLIELGNLEVARDISDVRYVANAYRSLLEVGGVDGDVVNICSGEVVTVADIINMCMEITGHKSIEVSTTDKYSRPNEVNVLQGDSTKLDLLIGSSSRISVMETLSWMLNS